MKLQEAYLIATRVKAELAPHCEAISIAGSIRRQVPEVSDIEICCIPRPYNVGLWADGIAAVLDKYVKVRGYLPCKAVQRMDHAGPIHCQAGELGPDPGSSEETIHIIT